MIQYFTNNVYLDEIINYKDDNNLNQSGGAKDISITFMYKKNYKLNLSDEEENITEKFDKIYLVTSDFSAYEMNKHILEDYYIITLLLDSNKIFKFKFMRDRNLEYLDADGFLKIKEPFTENGDDYPADGTVTVGSKSDVNAWTTRWRWIYPKQKDNLQIYYFSFFVPDFTTLNQYNRASKRMTTDNFGDDLKENMIKEFKIQNDKKKISQKDISGNLIRSFNLDDISVDSNDTNTDKNYYKCKVLLHNLGHNSREEYMGQYMGSEADFDNVITHYNNISCRNENMLEYFHFNILHNIEILGPQLSILESNIKRLLSKEEKDLNGGIPGSLFLHGRNTLQNNTLPHLDTYFYDQMVYYSKVDASTSLHTYEITIDGLNIRLSIPIEILVNPIVTLLNNFFAPFKNQLFNITSASLNSFPMTLAEYNEFMVNYTKNCKLYYEKWLVLNYLTNNNNTSPFKLVLNEYDISYIELSTIPSSDIIKRSLITRLNVILNNCRTSISFQTLNPISPNKSFYTMNTNCLYNPNVKDYFYDVKIKFLLNLNWIDKNIGNLLYEYTNNTTIANPIDPSKKNYPEYLYLPTTTENGPLKKLSKTITDNTKVDSFYDFIKTIYDDSEEIAFDKEVDTDSKYTGKESSLSKKIYDEFKIDYGGLDSKKIPITEPKLKNANLNVDNVPFFLLASLKENDNTIKLSTISKINNFLKVFETNIRKFSKNFWIDLEDIDLDFFLDKLIPENKVKLYYKLLFIVTFLVNQQARKIIISNDEIKINGNEISKSNALVIKYSSLDYYDAINTNSTLIKILQLARSGVITGKILLKTNDALLDNSYYKIKESNIEIDEIADTGDKNSFDDKNKFKAIKFKDKDNGDIELEKLLILILNALKNPEFIKKIDDIFKSERVPSPGIPYVLTSELKF